MGLPGFRYTRGDPTDNVPADTPAATRVLLLGVGLDPDDRRRRWLFLWDSFAATHSG